MDINDFINKLDIQKGELLLITGNLIKLIKKSKKSDKNFSLDIFLDLILERLGTNGTLVIQTFNWSFCNEKRYDIKNSKSMTGTLGNVALKRDDFKRTLHPIYSFAVSGKYQKELVSLTNKGAFSVGSPFDFLNKKKAKMIVIDLPLQHSFTFVHHVEELHNVSYRFNKTFKGEYIKFDGRSETLEYDMYVRDIENNILTSIEPLEHIFRETNVMQVVIYENIMIKKIDLPKSYKIVSKEIIENSAKNLYKIGEF